MPPNARRRKVKSNAVFRTLLHDKKNVDHHKHTPKAPGTIFHELPHMSQETAKPQDLMSGSERVNQGSSVLERDPLDEYLQMSLASQKKFTHANQVRLLMRQAEQHKTSSEHLGYVEMDSHTLVPIPRRPINYQRGSQQPPISPSELDVLENDAFFKWRLQLADIEEKKGKIMTPYEKNIQFWRQLWRVLERSHVVFQILDARNPCFYRSMDLEAYVNEINPSKKVILLLNKADLVPIDIRRLWTEYFYQLNTPCLFFSALDVIPETHHLNEPCDAVPHKNQENTQQKSCHHSLPLSSTQTLQQDTPLNDYLFNLSRNGQILSIDNFINLLVRLEEVYRSFHNCTEHPLQGRKNSDQVANHELDPVHTVAIPDSPSPISESSPPHGITEHHPSNFVAGFVGYPNVGKSSILNALLGHKVVGVSRQPGKTKHFQTFFLPNLNITLCDCPGLVFPQIVSTRDHLLTNGVTCIDHMRGVFTPAIQLICDALGNQLLDYYSLKLRNAKSGRKTHLDAREFLTALAESRHQIAGGRGGVPRLFDMAKLVLKDYCSGNLIHWTVPPKSPSHQTTDLTTVDGKGENSTVDDSDDDEFLPGFFAERQSEKAPKLFTQRKTRFMQKRITQGKKIILSSV